jgi:hypothetical protein
MDASPPTPPPRHPGSPLVTRGGGPVDTGAAAPVAPVYCSLDDKAVGITWATAERERAQQLALTYDLQSTLGGATGHTQQQRRCARAACTAASPCFVYIFCAPREAGDKTVRIIWRAARGQRRAAADLQSTLDGTNLCSRQQQCPTGRLMQRRRAAKQSLPPRQRRIPA